MTSKIRELAQEATEWCQENAHGTPVAWEWEDKFAELIVRECLDACNENNTAVLAHLGIAACVKSIRSRFGVDNDLRS